jgi:chemotaxis protein MotB
VSIGADGEPRQEIIIVRRGSHDDDDVHHGGIWKIAFADFMTAMMCFFLVMWLINAANEQTRVALASYFNPVKLIDRNTSRKGLDNPDMTDPLATSKDGDRNDDSKPSSGAKENKAKSKNNQPAVDTGNEKHASNDKLFSDPYAVLSEIAGETGVKQNISSKGDGGAQDAGPATGASGGKAYRDPFAPDFWSEQVDRPNDAIETTLPAPAGKAGAATPAKPAEAKPVEEKHEPKPASAPEQKAVARLAPTDAKPAEPAKNAAVISAKMAGEAHAIRQELAREFGKGDKVYQGLSVVATDKGIAISVTDQLNYGMFEIGSAVPRKELVLAMEKIARTLEAHKGRVRINGYTDARPYKGGSYDNWQLSAARAEAAYYMLIRAGFDEKRVLSITGYADRKLKVKDDPYADANRRIEILLEPAG